MDSNWSADVSFAAPKRATNNRCTAGTKDVPPVRNTLSIACGPMFA